MKIEFQKNLQLADDEISIVVQAAEKTLEVTHLIDYLAKFGQNHADILPIKSDDRILMVRAATIIKVEVGRNSLMVYSTQDNFSVNERLYKFKERFDQDNFIQISKSTMINIDHLLSLEDSFSGTMTAILTGQIKANVSRKYLADLAKRLGL